MRTASEGLLGQARAVRAAYPDDEAMQAVSVTPLPEGNGWTDLRAALLYLRQETMLVRGGGDGVGVLDDEIAHTEGELALLGK